MDENEISYDQASLAELRSNVYGFLSMLYSRPPTRELLSHLKDHDLRAALEDIGVVFDSFFNGENDELTLKSLVHEYTHLFIGPGFHIPPFESVHSDEGKAAGREFGQMLGAPALQVRDVYLKHGYEPLNKFKDMPDHLGVELGFMRLLSQYEKAAWDQGKKDVALEWLETQRKFLQEHLAAWVPAFCERASDYAQLSFYKSLVDVTREFIRAELDFLPPFVVEAKEI